MAVINDAVHVMVTVTLMSSCLAYDLYEISSYVGKTDTSLHIVATLDALYFLYLSLYTMCIAWKSSSPVL